MNRFVLTGLTALLCAAGMIGTTLAEDAGSAGQGGQKPDAPCAAKDRGDCVCLMFKYAQFYDPYGNEVCSYYGMLCTDDWAGTVSYDGACDLHTAPDNSCEPGQPCPGTCIPGVKETRKKGQYAAEKDTLEKGAKKVHKNAPVATVESLLHTTTVIGKDLFADIFLDEGDPLRVKLWLIRVSPKKATQQPVAYFGVGQEYEYDAYDPPDPHERIRIYKGQVEAWPEEATQTRCILIAHGGVTYRVLLSQDVQVTR